MGVIMLETPIEIDPAASITWTDLNLDDHIEGLGANVTGAIFRCQNLSSATDYAMGFRKKGSTDARTTALQKNAQTQVLIGVDNNRKCQYYMYDTANFKCWLVGYTTTGVVMLTNGIDKWGC